ncbi:hypothetical protein, partial [Cohnella sp.]|uniref:hypothetical protein n=1 Tax=Cohnella sp. TaxID=1883426 RepID=UPI003565F926
YYKETVRGQQWRIRSKNRPTSRRSAEIMQKAGLSPTPTKLLRQIIDVKARFHQSRFAEKRLIPIETSDAPARIIFLNETCRNRIVRLQRGVAVQ